MKRITPAWILLLSPVSLLAAEVPPDAAWVEQSRQLVMQLGGQLKGELGKAIEAAMPLCTASHCQGALAAGWAVMRKKLRGRINYKLINPFK